MLLTDAVTPDAIQVARDKMAVTAQAQGGSPTAPIGAAPPDEAEGFADVSQPAVHQGVDNFLQQNPEIDNLVNGDLEAEEEYVVPDPIDLQDIGSADSEGLITYEEVQKYGDTFVQLIQDAVTSRKAGGRDDAMDSWRDIFEGSESLGPGPWRNSSKIRPPDVRTATETVIAREHDALFGGKFFVRVKPDIEYDSDVASKWENYYMAEMGRSRLNLPLHYLKALKDARVDGGVIGRTYWKRSMQKERQRVKINQSLLNQLRADGHKVLAPKDPVELEKFPVVQIDGKKYRFGGKYLLEVETVKENHFGFDFINMQDFFMFPATSARIEDASVVGYFYGATLSDIWQGVADHLYDEQAVKDMIERNPRAMGGYGDDIQSGTLGGLSRSDREQQIDRTNEGDVERYGKLRMACFWFKGHVPKSGKVPDPILVHMEMSTPSVLAFQRNPFHNNKLNMKDMTPDPRVGGGFYGYSLPEKLRDMHKEIGSMVRMGIDLATLASVVYVEMESGTMRKVSDMEMQPGINFIDTDEDGQIKKVSQINPITQNALPLKQEVRDMIQKVASADDLMQGAQSGGVRPVGETTQRLNSAGIRMKMSLLCQLDYLTWQANQFFDYHKQYMEESRSFQVRRNGQDVAGVLTPDDLAIPCSVEAYCEDIENDTALRQQFMEKIFTALAQSPFAQSDMARLHQILSDYVQAMGADYDLTPRIGTQEEAKRMQAAVVAQQQAAQQLQAQAQLQGAPIGAAGSPQGGAPAPQGAPSGQPVSQPDPSAPLADLLHHAIDTMGQRPNKN